MSHRLIRVFLIPAAAIILGACAEVVSPPGGPVDRQAPFLMSSEPTNGSTGVSQGNKITLFFSESVVKPENIKTVFISPRQSVDPKIKWKSDRVEITLAESFDLERTYIAAIGSNITDLRGNRIDSTLMIAFSTGSSIDSGSISGVIKREGGPAAGLFVSLYDLPTAEEAINYDSTYPEYLTQTNGEGKFRFDYLPAKVYRLIAFEDRNKNELFNLAREGFAVPDREVVVGGIIPVDNLLMRLTSLDTLTPEITSVSVTADGLIRLRLSKEIDLKTLALNDANFLIWPITDSTAFRKRISIVENEKSSTVHIWAGNFDPGFYQCRLTYDYHKEPLVSDTFEVKSITDKEPPKIVDFKPAGRIMSVENLDMVLTLSEPIAFSQLADESILLWNDHDSIVPMTINNDDPLRLKFESQAIRGGRSYRLDITEFEVTDRSGNFLGDSLSRFTFSILDDDSLGSVNGEITNRMDARSADRIVLKFQSLTDGQEYKTVTTSDQFKIDLPAGRYLLSGFIDSDNDEKIGLGSIDPYQLAETTAIYPDTVAVRARFETSGITFVIQ